MNKKKRFGRGSIGQALDPDVSGARDQWPLYQAAPLSVMLVPAVNEASLPNNNKSAEY
ncbi:protein of unknown function [Magnetospira sp. QH-2]|nr:protein of unknown function [Magnetospira sp. QH-2]